MPRQGILLRRQHIQFSKPSLHVPNVWFRDDAPFVDYAQTVWSRGNIESSESGFRASSSIDEVEHGWPKHRSLGGPATGVGRSSRGEGGPCIGWKARFSAILHVYEGFEVFAVGRMHSNAARIVSNHARRSRVRGGCHVANRLAWVDSSWGMLRRKAQVMAWANAYMCQGEALKQGSFDPIGKIVRIVEIGT